MDPVLVLENITKQYGVSRVLDSVSMAVGAGEIHAAVGENGAGKSTLMRIAAGLVRPDQGRVLVGGHPIRCGVPRSARSAGISIVTQELTSVPARSVLENVALGMRGLAFCDLRHSAAVVEFRRVCDLTGFSVDPTALVADLSLADQQILEVLRSLVNRPRVLILDEPTASIDQDRARQLLIVLRHLAESGMAVLFVSHHLKEVLAVADSVTVLRDGRVIDSKKAADETETSLIRKMVGRQLLGLSGRRSSPSSKAEVVLEARDIKRGNSVLGVSVIVRAGEIVGLAGLVGAGRTEFARCLVGADRCDGGTVAIGGSRQFRPRHPSETMALGLAMVPEDRKGQGLVLGRSVADNLALCRLGDVGRWGISLPRQLEREANVWITRADIRPPRADLAVGTLSGGNQQKVLLSKWLAVKPKVLIADEPTRGVDVGAKQAIHEVLLEAAASGIGILLISSELEELTRLAHRVIVFRKGEVVAEFSADEANPESVMTAAFGAAVPQPAL